MNGVDVLMDTFWRIWTDLLDVLGIDGKCDACSPLNCLSLYQQMGKQLHFIMLLKHPSVVSLSASHGFDFPISIFNRED